jgi:hypothetical protein
VTHHPDPWEMAFTAVVLLACASPMLVALYFGWPTLSAYYQCAAEHMRPEGDREEAMRETWGCFVRSVEARR